MLAAVPMVPLVPLRSPVRDPITAFEVLRFVPVAFTKFNPAIVDEPLTLILEPVAVVKLIPVRFARVEVTVVIVDVESAVFNHNVTVPVAELTLMFPAPVKDNTPLFAMVIAPVVAVQVKPAPHEVEETYSLEAAAPTEPFVARSKPFTEPRVKFVTLRFVPVAVTQFNVVPVAFVKFKFASVDDPEREIEVPVAFVKFIFVSVELAAIVSPPPVSTLKRDEEFTWKFMKSWPVLVM